MVKRSCDQKQSGVALILLISFVLGSVLSFVYEDSVNSFLQYKATSRRAILTQCFALSCIIAPSVNGRIFIPLFTAISGAAVVTELETICSALSFPAGKSFISVLLFLILLPVYFIVSGWGMNKSIELGNIIRRNGLGYTKDNLFSLTIMFIGLGLLLFGQNIMPI